MKKKIEKTRIKKQKTERMFYRQERPGVLSAPVQQALPPEWNRFTMDAVDYMEKRNYGLTYDEPQAIWTKGCPLGNGDLGALVYGAPEALHFSLGKTDLWDYRSFGQAMHPPVRFDRLREISGPVIIRRLNRRLPKKEPKAGNIRLLRVSRAACCVWSFLGLRFPASIVSGFPWRMLNAVFPGRQADTCRLSAAMWGTVVTRWKWRLLFMRRAMCWPYGCARIWPAAGVMDYGLASGGTLTLW